MTITTKFLKDILEMNYHQDKAEKDKEDTMESEYNKKVEESDDSIENMEESLEADSDESKDDMSEEKHMKHDEMSEEDEMADDMKKEMYMKKEMSEKDMEKEMSEEKDMKHDEMSEEEKDMEDMEKEMSEEKDMDMEKEMSEEKDMDMEKEMSEEDMEDMEKQMSEEKDMEKEMSEEEMKDMEKEMSEEKDMKHDEMSEEDMEKEMSEEEKKDIEDATKAMLNGEELSESFKEKVSTIFEASLKRASKNKILAETKKIEESFESKLNSYKEELSESLVNKLDGYLDYVVEEWMKTNEVALESSIRSDITENFIVGLRSLFETHYIDVPEDKLDVLSEQSAKIESLEAELNEEINKNIELKKEKNNLKKNAIISEISEGMSRSEASKFFELCEGVSFSDEKSFENKLVVIKENYFPNSKKVISNQMDDVLLTEGGIHPETTPEVITEFDTYANIISKMINSENGRK